MNIKLAHHWLVGMRGGEKVLEEICSLYPDAPIYTLVSCPRHLSAKIRSHRIIESPLRFIPAAHRLYKNLLPLFPLAINALRVPAPIQFVFSTDASMIKGLRWPPEVPHVCYCHSPPRYLWDLSETYLDHTADLGLIGKLIFRSVIPRLREFDRLAAQRVTHFIANSKFVQERIKTCYGRESTVIHPPVALQDFVVTAKSDDFYLIVSELAPYKRIDIAVDAFKKLGKRLVVIGRGSELEYLKSMAGPTIEFLGSQPFAVLKRHYETCRAFIFPGIEDFGITPLEAQAAGKPVIGFAKGGLLETTIEGKTAVYFREQTVEALVDAVRNFESGCLDYDPQYCREQAQRFSPEKFRQAIKDFLMEKYPAQFEGYAWGDV